MKHRREPLTIVQIALLRSVTYRSEKTIAKWHHDPSSVQPAIREQLDAAAKQLLRTEIQETSAKQGRMSDLGFPTSWDGSGILPSRFNTAQQKATADGQVRKRVQDIVPTDVQKADPFFQKKR